MKEYSEEELRKAYVEVLEVLNFIPRDEYYQIPRDVIENMRNNKNIYYNYVFNGVESLSRLACIIIVDIYTKYIANKDEKKLVIDILKLNEMKHKEE